MAVGTGFVNFQQMLNANRPYADRVRDEREAAGQAVTDYTDKFKQFEDDYQRQLGVTAYDLNRGVGAQYKNLSNYGPAQNPNYFDYIPLSRESNALSGEFRPSSGSSGLSWNYKGPDVTGFNTGVQGFERDISDTQSEALNRQFGTDVNRIGSAGESALDRAIYGDLYGTTDSTFKDYQASLPGAVEDQFSNERAGAQSINDISKKINTLTPGGNWQDFRKLLGLI